MAKLKKTPKQFRLDFDCIAYLEAIAKKKGGKTTETDVIQMAVAELAEKELTAEEREIVVMKKFQEILKSEKSD